MSREKQIEEMQTVVNGAFDAWEVYVKGGAGDAGGDR